MMRTRKLGVGLAVATCAGVLASACGGPPARVARADGGAVTDGGDAGTGSGVADAGSRSAVTITATVGSTRFTAREDFIAAGEMQISGEPLAEAMGRDLSGYSRDHLPTDIYFDSSPVSEGPWIDLAGFSTAVESYEYSKQPMNNVAFESGAGTSLVYGPLVNRNGDAGQAAVTDLADLVHKFAAESHALGRFVFQAGTFPVGSPGSGDPNLNGSGTGDENPLGWPGIWPTVHVFRSFDPTINPAGTNGLGCAITSDDDPGATGALRCADYECDATSLHLPDRAGQVEQVVTPGADGWSGWKYGLWVLNYLQVMHDATEASVTAVPDGDVADVGVPGNQVVGTDDSGDSTAAGTYLGSSDIEGFQAAMLIEEMDNRAEDWLRHFATADGAHLGGFTSLNDALAYSYSDPLRWFPGAIAVTDSADAGSPFPRPGYALASADSDLTGELGMARAYAEMYALTDTANTDVGGAEAARIYFDGDPFPADDQRPDGQDTLHDRALAIMRVAVINIDRLHTDPASGYLVDHVSFAGATPTRGATVSTTGVALALLSLRAVRRALSSQLELYSNNTPDTAVGATALDALPIHYPADDSLTFSQRLDQMIKAEADLLYNHLTDAGGRTYDGWDVSTSAPVDTKDLLDAHTAAVRGLFAAYLATGDSRYRDRAIAVFHRIESVFYDPDARIYTPTPAPVDQVTFTPLRFALLQSTLRDMYELVAARPGGEALEIDLEERIARLNKLVLNGWDDRNGNRIVDWPEECVDVRDGLPRGGLEMAERTLTGEIGAVQVESVHTSGQMGTPTSDRDHDCVPEIDDAHLPAALAASITFHLTRKAAR